MKTYTLANRFPKSSILLLSIVMSIALLASAAGSCAFEPLKIGYVGPLTGPSSAVGLGARNGFLMALGDGKGAAPGRIAATKLIVKDDGNDQDRCLQAFQDLKAEGCRLVVLGTTSQAARKAIPWAIAEGMLVISPTVTVAEFSGKDDLFFRVNVSSDSFGRKLARTIHERTGMESVGFIGDTRNESYKAAIAGAFSDTFASLGGKTSFALDFDSSVGIPEAELVRAIRTTGTGAVVIVAASTEVVVIAKILEKEGLGTRLFLPPWPLTIDLLKNGGDAVEGTIAVSASDLEYRTDGGKAFRAAYLEEYGEEPSFTAMFGWEGTSILRRSLSASGKTDPLSVKRSILGTGTFRGLQGDIVFDGLGDASRSEFLFTIQGGRFVRME